jgi:L-lactate dehydrogenase
MLIWILFSWILWFIIILMSMHTNKIAIAGSGTVGATIAYASLIRGLAGQIVLYDPNKSKVEAEALDLSHGLPFVSSATVEGSDDIEICRDAEIIIITAGARETPGLPRTHIAAANTDIYRNLIPRLVEVSPQAILLPVTNPVDVMTYVALKLSGFENRRVLGSGTVIDSARFRYLIAHRLKVSTQSVRAYIVGEHGDSQVPLWSSATVGNIPLHEWAVPTHGKLSVPDRVDIFQNVKMAAYHIIQGKHGTNYGIGLATSRILDAILHDESCILPVSSLLNDYYGIDDVCVSVPCITNRTGIDTVLEVPFNEAELAGLRNSADIVRAAIRSVGF